MKKIISIILIALVTLSLCVGCTQKDENTIIVGASATPHAEILETVKPILEEQGYKLEIKVYDDYILPNTATEDGDLDANYFQHTPYLESFNTENGTHLTGIIAVHYEPYGIYAGTSTTLKDIPDGAAVAVPNDPTNEARALQLLADNGLITLKEGVGLAATKNDIVDNPKNLDIKEMEAAIIPGCLDSVAVAVINGNYAISAGLKVADALAVEDKNSAAAQTYANILALKEGNQDLPAIKALKEALLSDTVKEFIQTKYEGAVVAIF
ncbi:MAG: MetQ/NlpA family ABC transporter substrate-binding protein [Clostridia bacterium]|nr:MetQ/NlpA family ABC transporter substrate-binding protein [Clostridia bacterium]